MVWFLKDLYNKKAASKKIRLIIYFPKLSCELVEEKLIVTEFPVPNNEANYLKMKYLYFCLFIYILTYEALASLHCNMLIFPSFRYEPEQAVYFCRLKLNSRRCKK